MDMVVEYRGEKYVATEKEGKVIVRIERTARGQNVLAGVFDPKQRTWQNDDLPRSVKEQIETKY